MYDRELFEGVLYTFLKEELESYDGEEEIKPSFQEIYSDAVLLARDECNKVNELYYIIRYYQRMGLMDENIDHYRSKIREILEHHDLMDLYSYYARVI